MLMLRDFDYVLPDSAIAQSAVEPRDSSRLLVLDRDTGKIEHATFRDLPHFLAGGDLLVRNNTRVTAVRLRGKKETGGSVEALLIRALGDGQFEALVKPAKRLQIGARIEFPQELTATVTAVEDSGERVLSFGSTPNLEQRLKTAGTLPLPPYFRSNLEDADRYQTIYATAGGSSAAPTAGLHFTQGLFSDLERQGTRTADITLDVGLDTFRPVKSEDLSEHKMHGERYCIPPETSSAISQAAGRIIAVGTTVVRTLETAAIGRRTVKAGPGCSSLFITPGFQFQIVDALLTNFHMPRTTMMMLVSALCGRERLLSAYGEALRENYRFLSFGDSMLVIRRTP
jgi:S-adenosylmethionine:tRNA ribosyltransferase-isomerase